MILILSINLYFTDVINLSFKLSLEMKKSLSALYLASDYEIINNTVIEINLDIHNYSEKIISEIIVN